VEQSMRCALTKMDVRNVVLLAVQHVAKHQCAEERVVRAAHIADAQYHYIQTDEYKDKPNSFIDHRDKPDRSHSVKKSLMQHTITAIVAYEQAKLMKSEHPRKRLK